MGRLEDLGQEAHWYILTPTVRVGLEIEALVEKDQEEGQTTAPSDESSLGTRHALLGPSAPWSPSDGIVHA